MQKLLTILLTASLGMMIASCGGARDDKGALGDKKAELEKLKKEQKTVNEKIAKLEEEISKVDSSVGIKAKLVALATIGSDTFTHFIDLQGKVEAKNIAYASSKTSPGVVQAVYVKQGDRVSKGQRLLKLDDAVQRQNVASAEQQVAGINAQLEQAKSVYQRQQNLWKENIGTELQVLNAKTNVDALQSQLNAAKANLQVAKDQLNFTTVTAEISGVVNTVNVRVGETFPIQGQQTPQIQIVNSSDLKVLVQVPENYLGKIGVGSNLRVTLPEVNKVINTKISVVSPVIDPVNRSFYIEGQLPSDKTLRPNQVAVVQIQDYRASNAITIPVNTLGNDEKGKFVMVAVMENGKLIARKKAITAGELYGENLEVKSGLQTGDKIIVEGFQGLYDGQVITTN